MITLRRAADRGRTTIDWLDSAHTFSFGGYFDPQQMGFGPLRVINDDRVSAGSGFGAHPHRDMEIVSYVLSGGLSHRDSMGNGSTIRPGDVQRMSAGTGVVHSEWNASESAPVHFLQIWIQPRRRGSPPRYDERNYATELQDRWRLVVSEGGRDGSIEIDQAAEIWASRIGAGRRLTHAVPAGHRAWLHVARGTVRLAGNDLSAGDGAAIVALASLEIEATSDAELLLFVVA